MHASPATIDEGRRLKHDPISVLGPHLEPSYMVLMAYGDEALVGTGHKRRVRLVVLGSLVAQKPRGINGRPSTRVAILVRAIAMESILSRHHLLDLWLLSSHDDERFR